jgi:hypothetical protein
MAGGAFGSDSEMVHLFIIGTTAAHLYVQDLR